MVESHCREVPPFSVLVVMGEVFDDAVRARDRCGDEEGGEDDGEDPASGLHVRILGGVVRIRMTVVRVRVLRAVADGRVVRGEWGVGCGEPVLSQRVVSSAVRVLLADGLVREGSGGKFVVTALGGVVLARCADG